MKKPELFGDFYKAAKYQEYLVHLNPAKPLEDAEIIQASTDPLDVFFMETSSGDGEMPPNLVVLVPTTQCKEFEALISKRKLKPTEADLQKHMESKRSEMAAAAPKLAVA